MVMLNVDPELVSVAVPVSVQFVDRLPEASQVPVADSVAVVSVELPLLVSVKLILPGTMVVDPLQVRVNT
jgi:hypothetical protein